MYSYTARCGFEFTASPKLNQSITNNNLHRTLPFHSIHRVDPDKIISDYNWINERYSSDPCGCEVSTPILYDLLDVTKYYLQFTEFVRKSNLTINKEDCDGGLGGCHIHMDLKTSSEFKSRSKEDKIRLLRNIIVFMTNYPELNWAFNDPNDNWNANSFLSCIPTLIPASIQGNSFTNSQLIHNTLYHVCYNSEMLYNVLDNPLQNIPKDYCIRYNKNYDTVEFRIFDMPTTLDRHILHYCVANSIYNYCAQPKLKLSLDYLDFSYYDFRLKYSLKRFDECMNILNINSDLFSEVKDNIRLRYEWNKESELDNYLV